MKKNYQTKTARRGDRRRRSDALIVAMTELADELARACWPSRSAPGCR